MHRIYKPGYMTFTLTFVIAAVFIQKKGPKHVEKAGRGNGGRHRAKGQTSARAKSPEFARSNRVRRNLDWKHSLLVHS
jgi:hypothetical protein